MFLGTLFFLFLPANVVALHFVANDSEKRTTMGIRYKIRTIKIDKLFSNSRRDVVYPNLQAVRTMGILRIANDPQGEVWLSDLKRRFGSSVQFSVLEFDLSSKDKSLEKSRITSACLDIWGLPKAGLLAQFVEQPFDVLLNLSIAQSDVIDFVAIKSKAKFKVSAIATSPYYDLIVNAGSGKTINYIGEFVRILENLKNRS